MGWWQNAWRTRAEDWTFYRLERKQLPVSDQTDLASVDPESGYLDIFLRSMRIVDVRRRLAKFSGTVHSFISLPHLSGDRAQFGVVATPDNLKEIDAANVDRVISMNQRLLGPVPYRGGDLEIELGLLSVKSSDLAVPYLSVLETMSRTAGVSYVSAAMPFIGPLVNGINLLAGCRGHIHVPICYLLMRTA